jgi:hypothetical protein
MRAVVIAAAAVLSQSMVGACDTPHQYLDDRGWFRSFVDRLVSDVALQHSSSPITSLAPPYVAECHKHRADVSWQAIVRQPPPSAYPSRRGAIDGISKLVSSRTVVVSRLSSNHIHIIQASAERSGVTDTLVLSPSSGTRVQVSAPAGAALIADGYVSC